MDKYFTGKIHLFMPRFKTFESVLISIPHGVNEAFLYVLPKYGDVTSFFVRIGYCSEASCVRTDDFENIFISEYARKLFLKN